MSRGSLEGARCAELPPEFIDKYYHANLVVNPILGQLAMGICAQCPVMDECRRDALTRPDTKETGVVAGTTANKIRIAKAWRLYELGLRDTPPTAPRPEWLPMNEATHAVEAFRTEFEVGDAA
jgi:hypothetical protein